MRFLPFCTALAIVKASTLTAQSSFSHHMASTDFFSPLVEQGMRCYSFNCFLPRATFLCYSASLAGVGVSAVFSHWFALGLLNLKDVNSPSEWKQTGNCRANGIPGRLAQVTGSKSLGKSCPVKPKHQACNALGPTGMCFTWHVLRVWKPLLSRSIQHA